MQNKRVGLPAHLRPVALAAVLAAGIFGAHAEQSMAAYTAQIKAGTLRISGDAASDKLALRLQPGVPGNLEVDFGADGTADLTFDRGTFTAINVSAGPGDDEVRIDHSFGSFPDELVTLGGGDGADRLLGGIGAETLVGGNGNDLVAGGDGDDLAMLGAGNDQFSWNPGDDNDRVEGQTGADVLDFNGSNIGEIVDISADGTRARLTRNVASIVMDVDDLERVAVRTFGGADSVTVGDLTGTDLKTADVDLAAFAGGGDLEADTVIAMGTDAADSVSAGGSGAQVVLGGPAAQTRIAGGEPDVDMLQVQTLGGNDDVAVGSGVAGVIVPIVDLGPDE